MVDPKQEHNAVAEAKVLGIPVVAITDTNCDPDNIDHIIPGNDDALKSIKLFANAVATAYLDGAKAFEEKARAQQDKAEIAAKIHSVNKQEAGEERGPKRHSTTDREGRTVGVIRRGGKPEKGTN